jgi:CRISPR-associated endonuclease/helicase Cas3
MTGPTQTFITDYWGKAQPADSLEPLWHPQAYHGLDVAAAGDALLSTRPQLLAALARTSGLPELVARQWLLFALALHDIGKYADCFQCKVPELWRHQASWVEPPSFDPGHGRTGLALWDSGCRVGIADALDFASLFGPPSRDRADVSACFRVWFAAVCGHHGRPVEPHDLSARICDDARTDAAAYVLGCATLFDPLFTSKLPRDIEKRMKGSSWLVAGLAMLADWIGSNQQPGWFPYLAPHISLADYWPVALERARAALPQSGLFAPTIAPNYTLGHALPGVEGVQASPLQKWADADATIDGQSLVVIEDLTGAGKTEAGLILAHRQMRAGAAEGLYWALPTMATADALYRRLATSYSNLFGDPALTSLVLAHSSREFNDVFKKSLVLGALDSERRYGAPQASDGDATETASAACARWIADDRRKTFLADVGVGTIDQAILAVLPSKHQAMRLAGLCRRVLVIDEIHSMDAYQNALVEALLGFHAALGGSAILISATLTLAARQRLVAAFSAGAGWPRRGLADQNFPLATIVDALGVREQRLEAGRGTRRDLGVHRLHDASAALNVLVEAARDGRAAVWIRNTVQDARDAHRDLQALLPDAEIGLFHARFALGDRLAIEQGVLANFGKKSEAPQRQRILIATQVVEQSLDCDWDVMITDLAPIDLIIQRAGRLHRHDHRPARPAPLLHVVAPEPTQDASATWYEGAFPRAAFVYPHHGRLWLTMKVLLDAGGLNLASASPRDLIERVYAADAAIPSGLEQPSGKAEGHISSERAVGRMNALDLAKGYVHQAGAWESDTRTPTRLGDPTRMLRLARWDGRSLVPWMPVVDRDIRRAWRLSEVSVLAARVRDIAPPDPVLKRAMAIETATWPDRYDHPLLVPLVQGDTGIWEAAAFDERDRPGSLLYSKTSGLIFDF